MSRIFSAIQKAGGDLASISQEVLAGEMAQDSQTAAASDWPSPVAVLAEEPAEINETASPAVAEIATVSARIEQGMPIFPFDGLNPRAAEQYRMIRTRIIQHAGHPRLLAITSPGEGDGKTTTSINIAASLALKSDTTVLLIEADLRRPALAKYLGIPSGPGLVDVVEGKCTLQQAIVRIEQVPNLYVLPAGAVRRNPSELLDSAAWRDLVRKLQTLFLYTVLDTPPAGSVADFALLQALVEGVVLVSRPDRTSRAALSQALSIIPKSLLIGAVLNSTADWLFYRAPAYHYYGS